MDTHDASDSERGDILSVTLAAESLSESACPQPGYQKLVEAQVMEAMPGMFMVPAGKRSRRR